MTPELLGRLPVVLPAGSLITDEEGRGECQPLWLSSAPASLGLWSTLHRAHADTGVWPLLLDSYSYGDSRVDFTPWQSGEIYPREMTSPDRHVAADLLAAWWQEYAGWSAASGMATPRFRDLASFPVASARPSLAVSMAAADEFAEMFLVAHSHARLGLVAAESGAHALAAVGWQGPINYDNDIGKFAAVVASWQDRFGARVVAVGGGTLDLSVAAPPTSRTDALAVASQHFAFCPDNIVQGSAPYTIAAYAERLIGARAWRFWWD